MPATAQYFGQPHLTSTLIEFLVPFLTEPLPQDLDGVSRKRARKLSHRLDIQPCECTCVLD